MGTNRLTRVNELIQHALADLLLRTINHPDYNAALVTLTRVVTSHDLRHARIFISVNAPQEVQFRTLGVLKHKRIELQKAMAKEVILKYTPQLIFELDDSVAKGAHVLGIIANLENEHPEWQGPEPKPGSDQEPQER